MIIFSQDGKKIFDTVHKVVISISRLPGDEYYSVGKTGYGIYVADFNEDDYGWPLGEYNTLEEAKQVFDTLRLELCNTPREGEYEQTSFIMPAAEKEGGKES